MQRRSFLTLMSLGLAAPSIVRASSLMALDTRANRIILWGDRLHDDTRALQAYVDGLDIYTPKGRLVGDIITELHMNISDTIRVKNIGRNRSIVNSTMTWDGTHSIFLAHDDEGTDTLSIDSCRFTLTKGG